MMPQRRLMCLCTPLRSVKEKYSYSYATCFLYILCRTLAFWQKKNNIALLLNFAIGATSIRLPLSRRTFCHSHCTSKRVVSAFRVTDGYFMCFFFVKVTSIFTYLLFTHINKIGFPSGHLCGTYAKQFLGILMYIRVVRRL